MANNQPLFRGQEILGPRKVEPPKVVRVGGRFVQESTIRSSAGVSPTEEVRIAVVSDPETREEKVIIAPTAAPTEKIELTSAQVEAQRLGLGPVRAEVAERLVAQRQAEIRGVEQERIRRAIILPTKPPIPERISTFFEESQIKAERQLEEAKRKAKEKQRYVPQVLLGFAAGEAVVTGRIVYELGKGIVTDPIETLFKAPYRLIAEEEERKRFFEEFGKHPIGTIGGIWLGGKAIGVAARPIVRKVAFKRAVRKLPKAERAQFKKLWAEAQKIKKSGLTPPVKEINLGEVERLPKKAVPVVEKFLLEEDIIVGGSTAHRTQGFKFKPKDVDIYSDNPVSTARKLANELKQKGIKRVSVIEKADSAQITIKGKGAFDIHTKSYFYENIREVNPFLPFARLAVTRTPSGIRVMKLAYQAQREAVRVAGVSVAKGVIPRPEKLISFRAIQERFKALEKPKVVKKKPIFKPEFKIISPPSPRVITPLVRKPPKVFKPSYPEYPAPKILGVAYPAYPKPPKYPYPSIVKYPKLVSIPTIYPTPTKSSKIIYPPAIPPAYPPIIPTKYPPAIPPAYPPIIPTKYPPAIPPAYPKPPIYPTYPPSFKIPPVTKPPKYLKKKVKRPEKQPAYNVFVKSKGKFIRVNKKGISRSDAIELGVQVVDNSAAATFQIKQAKGFAKQKLREGLFAPDLRKFRRPSPRGKLPKINTFVEKNKFRIDSFGEILDIPVQAQIQRARQRLFDIKPKKKSRKLF